MVPPPIECPSSWKIATLKQESSMANKKAEMRSGDKTGGTPSAMPPEAGGSTEDRLAKIATAAYLRAASRHFVGGDSVEDWLQAEIEIDADRHSR
jgi:Protein of unknown function (DUF2934)